MRSYVINANEHIKEKWTVGRGMHSVGALIVHSFFDQIPISITVFAHFRSYFILTSESQRRRVNTYSHEKWQQKMKSDDP